MAAPGCCWLGGREAGGERWRAQRKSLQIAPPKPIENRTDGRDAGNDSHQASWRAEGDQRMRLSLYVGQLRGEDMLVGGGGGGWFVLVLVCGEEVPLVEACPASSSISSCRLPEFPLVEIVFLCVPLE